MEQTPGGIIREILEKILNVESGEIAEGTPAKIADRASGGTIGGTR